MIGRKNAELATTAVLTQAAILSALDKDAAKEFKKTIGTLLKDMADGDP